MTTKLTEAGVQALPPCKLCGKQPRTGVVSEQIGCECVGWFYTPDQWRLLMTPEAKGETPREVVKLLCKQISEGEDELMAVQIERGNLIAERDSLQSKLAKSEDTLRQAASDRDGYASDCNRHLSRIAQLEQQLAEATKPGPKDIEDAIAEIDGRYPNVSDAYDVLKRAARQRKPSGDAVKLAEMVKDRHEHSGCYNAEKYKLDKNQYPHDWNIGLGALMQPLADSIIAQAAAGDSEPTAGDVTKPPGDLVTASTEGVARVPAADLLTAEERAWIERSRNAGYGIVFEPENVIAILDRLAPAPSAATSSK